MFTDDLTVEACAIKGSSSSRKHLDLVVRLRSLTTEHGVRIHIFHVARTRMIAQGTDDVFFDNYVPGLGAKHYDDGPDDHPPLWKRSEFTVTDRRCLDVLLFLVLSLHHFDVVVVGMNAQKLDCYSLSLELMMHQTQKHHHRVSEGPTAKLVTVSQFKKRANMKAYH